MWSIVLFINYMILSTVICLPYHDHDDVPTDPRNGIDKRGPVVFPPTGTSRELPAKAVNNDNDNKEEQFPTGDYYDRRNKNKCDQGLKYIDGYSQSDNDDYSSGYVTDIRDYIESCGEDIWNASAKELAIIANNPSPNTKPRGNGYEVYENQYTKESDDIKG